MAGYLLPSVVVELMSDDFAIFCSRKKWKRKEGGIIKFENDGAFALIFHYMSSEKCAAFTKKVRKWAPLMDEMNSERSL